MTLNPGAVFGSVLMVLACLVGANGSPTAAVSAGPVQRAWKHSIGAPRLFSPAGEDSILTAEAGLTVAQRIGRWARRFASAETGYRFGLADGGYVDQGALVDDRHLDCISLLYRCTELAMARSAREAVGLALARRFAGADLNEVVDRQGRVDYDHPAHLDYSLDMIGTGIWGRDITADLSGAMEDSVGSSRFRAGSFRFIPKDALAVAELAEGDLIWFVLDPAAALRREHGLVIGHVGILVQEGATSMLVHAASHPLPAWYDEPGVVKIPLGVYLTLVDKFQGIIVTRLSPG